MEENVDNIKLEKLKSLYYHSTMKDTILRPITLFSCLNTELHKFRTKIETHLKISYAVNNFTAATTKTNEAS